MCVLVCECVYVCWVGTGPGFRITAAMFQYPPLHICNCYIYGEIKNLNVEVNEILFICALKISCECTLFSQ